jgi:hypothetical protein
MSLSDAVTRFSRMAAIVNTDYGAHDQGNSGEFRGHGPEGLTIIRNERIDGPLPNGPNDTDNNAVKRPWVAISSGAPYHIRFGQLTTDDGSKPEEWMYTAFGGAPWLIRDGEKQQEDIDTCRGATLHSCASNVAQTIVAIDDRWLYLVVALGVDATGIADFMLNNLHPTHAIKLDGGGSSQLWYGGAAITQDNSRRLSHYLAIIAPAGDGIDWESPPDSGSWWEQFATSIRKWWDETSAGITQRVSDWWENVWADARQRFDEWWQRQQEDLGRRLEEGLVQALEQLCSGAAVSSAVVAVVWVQRRQRNSKD